MDNAMLTRATRSRLALVMTLAWLAVPADAQVVEYYHTDAIGNIRVIPDAAGNVLERHDYLPFGEECTTGPCASNAQAGQGEPKKFTGKERDAETGLDYFGARYYGSKIGRFTTTDPVYTWRENLVDPQRWNRYAYARNSPLRYMDPDGRVINLATAAGGAAIGGVIGFGGSAIAQYFGTGTVNWTDASAAGAGGAVAGSLAGLTFGIAPALAGSYAGVAGVGAVTNVAGGAVARAVDSSASTKVIDGKAALIDAGAGALGVSEGRPLLAGRRPRPRL